MTGKLAEPDLSPISLLSLSINLSLTPPCNDMIHGTLPGFKTYESVLSICLKQEHVPFQTYVNSLGNALKKRDAKNIKQIYTI